MLLSHINIRNKISLIGPYYDNGVLCIFTYVLANLENFETCAVASASCICIACPIGMLDINNKIVFQNSLWMKTNFCRKYWIMFCDRPLTWWMILFQTTNRPAGKQACHNAIFVMRLDIILHLTMAQRYQSSYNDSPKTWEIWHFFNLQLACPPLSTHLFFQLDRWPAPSALPPGH